MSRWLVTGSAGMLGQDLTTVLAGAGHEVTPAPRASLDVTDLEACRAAVRGQDVVVNAAAWTAVDDAETSEAQAFAVNATGAANLARACAEAGAELVQVSTDYVFAGDATTPYARVRPARAAVGLRAHQGRRRVGRDRPVPAQPGGAHRVAVRRRRAQLRVDHGPPRGASARPSTWWTTSTASPRGRWTWPASSRPWSSSGAPYGIYHATSSGETTWCGFAREIFSGLGFDPARVHPTSTAAFPRPAPRPAYSVLGHDAWHRAGIAPIRDWREALAQALPSVVAAR